MVRSLNAIKKKNLRIRLVFMGQVQGVGFRPFIFNLAKRFSLSGFVSNTEEGVVVEAQGFSKKLEGFVNEILQTAPYPAKILHHTQTFLTRVDDETDFCIIPSSSKGSNTTLITPDIATCSRCKEELFSNDDRRFLYPFTNCTHCGPRYSITYRMPYDRKHTSMANFSLCPTCQQEYDNPLDRRFHAQPNACPTCGPQVYFALTKNLLSKQDDYFDQMTDLPTDGKNGAQEIQKLADYLIKGGIAAIKGLGGFHLACNATNKDTIEILRQRKKRPHKALAIMVDSLETAKKIAFISDAERKLLESPESPIVLCTKKTTSNVAENLAPDTPRIGIMLPYTPIHHILFYFLKKILQKTEHNSPICALVMTSGNKSGEPICIDNKEALQNLQTIADAFLFHNRDIVIRADDSVVSTYSSRGSLHGKTLFYRRARGYAPSPILIPQKKLDPKKSFLATGADMKNTICLSKGENAFVSQHIGDLENIEIEQFHTEIANHLKKLFAIKPNFIVCDKHPNFTSSAIAQQYGLPVLPLQHHVAHAYAVLGENNFLDKAIILALDGTGYGEDGHLWGGEVLLVEATSKAYRRIAHLKPLLLPGGEVAIREPWRIAHGLLLTLGISTEGMPWFPKYATIASMITSILDNRQFTKTSTSCGRLFDAVSALSGVCLTTTYEGQAAIRFEAKASEKAQPYFFPIEKFENKPWILDTHTAIKQLIFDKKKGASIPYIASAFHQGLANGLVHLIKQLGELYSIDHVALTGGCCYNHVLLNTILEGLHSNSLTPLVHTQLPPGDGCISYGQIVYGTTHIGAIETES